MRSKTILALGLLNLLLLASLCFHNVFTRPAQAQLLGGGRPSDYLQISGEVQGLPAGVVFILDTRNNLLTLRTLDQGKLQDMPPIDLTRVFKLVKH